jgi:hypothetical protein
LILVGVLLAPSLNGIARAQGLNWARSAGGTDHDRGLGIAVDAAGNSYVTGLFTGSATFGLGQGNETTLTSAGGTDDMFVAKYDASGALVWARRAGGGSGGDLGDAIAVDGVGNSYVTGRFFDSATFGPGEVNQTTLTSAGTLDVFVAKYDPSGSLLWVTSAGGPDFEQGLGIAIDGVGNSYVTGSFDSEAVFGLGEDNETSLVGFADVFVAKYDVDGALVWARSAGSPDDGDQGNAIAVDGAGNSYVAGWFASSATFGPGEGNETILDSDGSADVFVAKYDASGALLWARRAGGAGNDTTFGIAVDAAGNSRVTGGFSGSATFGPGDVNEAILVSGGSRDAFVARYDGSGSLVWAKQVTGADFQRGEAIALDGEGNSYVAGIFEESATFGPGETNETTLTSAGETEDVFVASFDSGGALLWARRDGGDDGNDLGQGIAVDGAGNSYVTGRITGSATFGLSEANETTLTSSGLFEIFVAKYVSSNAAKLWLGLKNSDDQGTQFDVRASLRVNASLVAEGLARCVVGLTRNPSLAKEVAVPFGSSSIGPLGAGDVVTLTVSVRIGTNPDGSKCPGHSNAVGLRLYYDSTSRRSGFSTELPPDPFAAYFLHSSGPTLSFDDVAPTSTLAKQRDSTSIKFAGGNVWKDVGTWSLTVP